MAKYYDPVYLGLETEVALEDIALGDVCNGTTTSSGEPVVIGVGNITGLSSVTINSMELVAGTEEIDVSFLGLDGATWKGTWVLNASFTDVIVQLNATIPPDICGDNTTASVDFLEGTMVLDNPSIELYIDLEGETGIILVFVSSSRVTSAEVTKLEFDMGNYTIDLSSEDGQVEMGDALDDLLLADLSDVIAPFLLNITNLGLEEELPYEFSSKD